MGLIWQVKKLLTYTIQQKGAHNIWQQICCG